MGRPPAPRPQLRRDSLGSGNHHRASIGMSKALILAMSAGLVTACATPGPVSITGRVRSAQDQWLLAATEVELSLPDTTIRGRTDSLGRFQLSVARYHGCFRLVAKHIGYSQALANVRVTPGRVIDVGDLQLQSGGIPEIGALFWKFCRMTPDTVSYYAGVRMVVDSSD